MSGDGEIEAMMKIAAALESLDDAARQRALQWAFSRYRGARQLEVVTPAAGRPHEPATDSLVGAAYETFADLFEAARPDTEREKALVAAYWVQSCQGNTSFVSQALNAELKDLGHGVGNITEALTQLKDERPALILQLKKSGTSKQARKTYKLTLEGMKRVQAMARGGGQLDE